MFPGDQGFGIGGFMAAVIPVMLVIAFVVVIGKIVLNGTRYMKNAAAPCETVYGRIVAKRMHVSSHMNHHHHQQGMHPIRSSRTDYYITLEFDNGERREYLDVRNLYGLVAEGDEGYAAVQGDWIVAFERNTR
ncbi:DUF2500 domain-containing protein [Paenibacillus cisolokensis]